MTVCAIDIVTMQVPVPAQPPPLQPANDAPGSAVALSVTPVPTVYDSLQSAPQVMPVGDDDTAPVPVPLLAIVSVTWVALNIAVTVVAAFIVTAHVPVPEQPPPLQPANVEPALGVAVSVTIAPWAKSSVQSAPHEMPAGAEVTVPAPAPPRITVSVCRIGLNVAVTVVAAASGTMHDAVPVQPPPLQPAKIDPALGDAVSVTMVPALNSAEQVAPHEMPAGAEVTEPAPKPALVTVSAYWRSANSAVTSVAPLTTTAHGAVPVQPPPFQPTNSESGDATAVSVTVVAGGKVSLQSTPQLMPVGAEVIVPLPVPERVISSEPLRAKVAEITVGPVMVVRQAPVPAHGVPPPLTVQPTNSEVASVVAVRRSWLPWAMLAEQPASGQSMPAVRAATSPRPEPLISTVTRCCAVLNVAVTVVEALRFNVHVVEVPRQPPLQPLNSAPSSGVAVRVTMPSIGNTPVQLLPQSMPPGFEVTRPVPVPLRSIVSVTMSSPPSVPPSSSPPPSEDASRLVNVGESTEHAATSTRAASAKAASDRNDDVMRRSSVNEFRRPRAVRWPQIAPSSHTAVRGRSAADAAYPGGNLVIALRGCAVLDGAGLSDASPRVRACRSVPSTKPRSRGSQRGCESGRSRRVA